MLVGTGSGVPVSAVSPDIELLANASGDTVAVLLADINGSKAMVNVVAFSIAGTYTVVSGIVADRNHNSGNIIVTGPVGVPSADASGEVSLDVRPNPFHTSLTVRFALPERSHVRLAVYDVAGRMIRSIVDGHQDAGRHEASWDGAGQDGVRARGGMYFVRMTLSEGGGRAPAVVRRVVLVK
jgi:hypothetical protein